MNTADILTAVAAERDRQHTLWDRFHDHGWGDCSSPLVPDPIKLAVLVEEVGEVARALLERDPKSMRTELVQVAAVVFAWLEGMADDGLHEHVPA